MITLDLETKSYYDLTEGGAAVYSEHPTTDIICVYGCYHVIQNRYNNIATVYSYIV